MNLIIIIGGIVLALLLMLISIKLKHKIVKFSLQCLGFVSVVVAMVFAIVPLFNNLHYGLDLQGGFEILYEVSPLTSDEKLDKDMVYNTYKAILKRIDILGVSEPEITIEGENRIRIKLAGVTNAEEARNMISSTAVLTFRDASDNLLMTSSVLGSSAKLSRDEMGRPAVALSIKDTDTLFNVTNKVKDMVNNIIVIWLDFDPDTDSYMKEKNHCGTIESKCLSAASVNKAFRSDVSISGSFTEDEARNLAELINSGALPTKLTEISSRTVEATFGSVSLEETLKAGIIGIALVMLVMIIIYRFSGFVASVNILIYTVLSFLIFYLLEGVLTLPSIAAMLLGIGMAVDANVISNERTREQLKLGKDLKTALQIGNKESFSSIIDANITTVIAAVILFIFGQSSVKGFATMLLINIFTTILVMVVLSRLVLKLVVSTGFFDDKTSLFIGVNKKKVVKKEEDVIPFQKLDFNKLRKKSFLITGVVILISIVGIIFTGFNLGVDFTGGTNITINLANSDVSPIKNYIDNKYTIKSDSLNDSTYTIIIDEVIENQEISDLTNVLLDEYNVTSDIFVVSEVVKQELIKNALYSLLFAIIGIIVYVSLRFKFNYAISGIVALLHDILITILFFGLFNIEITSIFIAAILTIIGYSINATIVTFDMIRDKYKKLKTKPTEEDLKKLVNLSVRQTLTRSIITTLTTIVPVICLMIFGARGIFNFDVALLVGFIAGLYSSIFISNQLWLLLEIKLLKKPKANNKDLIDEVEEKKIKGINC